MCFNLDWLVSVRAVSHALTLDDALHADFHRPLPTGSPENACTTKSPILVWLHLPQLTVLCLHAQKPLCHSQEACSPLRTHNKHACGRRQAGSQQHASDAIRTCSITHSTIGAQSKSRLGLIKVKIKPCSFVEEMACNFSA